MKRPRGGSNSRFGSKKRSNEPLGIGQAVRDVRDNRTGVVVDFACQYAHPKAQPVFNYLIRWEDGQVQAVMETALSREHGLEVTD